VGAPADAIGSPGPTAPAPQSALEQRVIAIEQAIVPLVAKGGGPKISTKVAGYLTTVAAVGSYLISGQVPELPSWAHLAVTAIVTGITAYETAELT
jgi:hypothetical protein